MNKKIFFSGASILAAMALMGGATFAYFSSTASSTGNVFASGTLVLHLDDENEITPAATVTSSIGGSNMAPGDSVSGFISMHNGGSIAIEEVNLSATETVSSTPDLAAKLNITSAKIGNDSACTTGDTNITGSFTTLAALNSAGLDLPSSALAVGATKYLCLTFTLDAGTDDTYQGKTITETFTFVGHQSAANQ